MTTSFTLSHDSNTHELFAERVSETDSIETWRVYSRGDQNTFIELSNDRPRLHAQSLYTARYKWTVLEGAPQYRKMVTQITTYLEYEIRGRWKPPTKGVAEKKAAAAKQQGRLF